MKLKLILAVNILGFLPAFCLAEETLQNAVISKVLADHAIEVKSGNFSKNRSLSHSSANRSSAAIKNAGINVAASRTGAVSKVPANEKREAIKKRAHLVRHQ